MDHAYIAEQSLIERYHRGDLPPEEEIRFEAHFMACPECTAELEAARGFRLGIKKVAAEEAVRAQTVVQVSLLARLARYSRQWPAALTGALAAVLLTSSWFLAVAPSTDSGLSSPIANTPVFILSTVRSAGEPGAIVDLGRSEGSLALAVDVDFDPRIIGYRVSVLGESQQIVWQQSDLVPNDLEVLMVTFPSTFFEPGAYRLTVEGQVGDGDPISLAGYPFQVIE